METNLPTPMTARVYVNLPEGIWGYIIPILSDSSFENTYKGTIGFHVKIMKPPRWTQKSLVRLDGVVTTMSTGQMEGLKDDISPMDKTKME